jgi:uncharacterized Zn finger protein (UPF0148 family)
MSCPKCGSRVYRDGNELSCFFCGPLYEVYEPVRIKRSRGRDRTPESIKIEAEERRRTIRELREKGLTPWDIKKELKLNAKTVWEALQ